MIVFKLMLNLLVFVVYRDGHVSLQEYMAFMISRETENVQSAHEVEAAFRALTTGEKPYITAHELFAVSNVYFKRYFGVTSSTNVDRCVPLAA